MKSHILSKNDELYSCGVQNMIRKRLLEIETVQIQQSPTKNIVFCSEKHKIWLEKSSKFTLSTKSTTVSYKCQTSKKKCLYQNYEHLAIIRFVLQNITNKKNAGSMMKSNWKLRNQHQK